MRYLIPHILLALILCMGVAIAEPYEEYDYETMEMVTVYPQEEGIALTMDSELDLDRKIILEDTPDAVILLDPESMEPVIYLKVNE